MRILVLGVTGMAGSSIYALLEKNSDFEVHGTVRSEFDASISSIYKAKNIHQVTDIISEQNLRTFLNKLKPNVVINCIGIIKQITNTDTKALISVNSLFPHILAEVGSEIGARVIHLSTDCVFSGAQGFYTEMDEPDATDLYGKSKEMGEIYNGLTLRTSIIGHGIKPNQSLIDWFLSQRGPVDGYTKAIFSGLPTVVLARAIQHILTATDNDLVGLYHLAAQPISKFDLLTMVNSIYGLGIKIVPCDSLKIDRSLSGDKFASDIGFDIPCWPAMVEDMKNNALRTL